MSNTSTVLPMFTSKNKKLLKACEEGSLRKVETLYKKGANLRHTADRESFNISRIIDYIFLWIEKKNPMYIAAANGHLEIVKFLLRQGIDVEESVLGPDNAGLETRKSPLFTAIKAEHFEIVKCLVENGADINYLPSDEGAIWPMNYPIEQAKKCKNKNILRYLQNIQQEYKNKVQKSLSEQTSTRELKQLLKDEHCPHNLKQRALIALLTKYKNDPQISLLTRKIKREIVSSFAKVTFTQYIMRHLYELKMIPFVIQNNITDKFKRPAIKACIQYEGDNKKSLIETAVSNYFQTFGTKTKREPLSKYWEYRDYTAYNQLWNKFYLFHTIFIESKNSKANRKKTNKLKLPDEIIFTIISFLDNNSIKKIINPKDKWRYGLDDSSLMKCYYTPKKLIYKKKKKKKKIKI